MLSNTSQAPAATTAQPTPKSPPTSSADALDPRTPIEVASAGTGTTNDPAGTDRRPPGVTPPDTGF